MSEQHVVLRVGHADRYQPKGVPRSTVAFNLHADGDDPKTEVKEKHLWCRGRGDLEVGLYDVGLKPPQTALDLYRSSAAAYCADLRFPRRRNGYDDWTRQFILHVPVASLSRWSSHVQTLTELLGFLSGDRWRVELREQTVPLPGTKRLRRRKMKESEEEESEPFDAVCLFSGGLDSFIGAADAIAAGRNLLLMSHVPEGVARWVSPAQDRLKLGLAKEYADRRIEHVKITLNPPPLTEHTGKESTQRARSILFLAFGTLAAAAVGDSAPLIVPENGFISLNLPLTPGRIGSLSTRTTHPHTMSLYRQLLARLGIDVPVELPYMFKTKGEMLVGAKNPALVRKLAKESVSCASPNPWGPAKERHCGYCVPCIIRRAAMKAARLNDARRYRLNILKPGRKLTDREATHLKAFQLAIRNRGSGVRLSDLLGAGPLPASEGPIDEFRSVHDRGLTEVAAFLRRTV